MTLAFRVALALVIFRGGFAMAQTAPTQAQGGAPGASKDKSYEFEYPELLVTPSASERLHLESKAESGNAWTRHVAIQASALMTLFAATQANSDPGHNTAKGTTPLVQTAGLAATLVGAGWLGTTVALSAMYHPYATGFSEVQKLPTGNKREKLTRERLAEERLMAPAALASRLKWLAVASNFTVSAMIAATGANDMTKIAGGLSAVAAFAPLIFPEHWEVVGDAHESYKKKIYGPMASLAVIGDGPTRRIAPAAAFEMDL